MQPVVLDRCLGWLHIPTQPWAPGIVLCPALGREARWSYRTMRQLADRLAAEGLPTLRFDYPGTGDSPDWPDWEDPLTAWRESVHEAADWLRAQTGLEQVALCGLRFGALLAAEIASHRTDVAALALLSPILKGRTCARELRLASIGGEGDDGPADGIEVDGMVLPNATLSALGEMDLRALPTPPAPRILVLDEGNRAEALALQFGAQGAQTELQPFPGYAEMMRPATSNQVPHAALGAVAGWLGRDPAGPAPRLRSFSGARMIVQPGYREEAVLFGPAARLAGVLCEPAPGSATQAVLITNTGGDGRSGIGRFGTRLARTLAAAGVASLRFDFAGLGDSRLPDDADSHPYLTERAGDISTALDVLERRGYERLGGVGLCTGAYHLLQAALAEARFQRLVLINLVTFEWQPGDLLEVPQRALAHQAAASEPVATKAPHPAVTTILGRGTNLLLLLGYGDPGVAALQAHFGPEGQALAAMPGATVRVEHGIDHTLSRRVMQERVAGSIAAFLLPDGTEQPHSP